MLDQHQQQRQLELEAEQRLRKVDEPEVLGNPNASLGDSPR